MFETGDEPFVNEVVVCEVRAGMRHRDQPILAGILEPVEFIQPGPERPCWQGHGGGSRTSAGIT